MSADESAQRTKIALQRTYALITPDEIVVRAARTRLLAPLAQLAVTIAVGWALGRWMNALPLWLLGILFLFVIISGPVAMLGVVYNVMGSSFLMERRKRTCRFQQGAFGLGLGTRELIPFERIARVEVGGDFEEELASGDLQDVVRWELRLIKDNGRVLPFGSIIAARPLAAEALARANAVVAAAAAMCGAPAAPGTLPAWAFEDDEDGEDDADGSEDEAREADRQPS